VPERDALRGRGFTVVDVPCNQFAVQDPGTSAEIESFCSSTYGVTFPMTAKLDVNGPRATLPTTC
jgi:glutathione peroxidase